MQSKLNDLAELIAKLGAGAGLLLFVALMIRFFVQLHTEPQRCVPASIDLASTDVIKMAEGPKRKPITLCKS